MSEQKYYVRFKTIIFNVRGYSYDEHYISYDEHYISGTNFYLDVLKEFSPEESKFAFTASELAEIMDGALYRKPFLGETGIQPEWINPLIELVPVEGNE